MSDLKGSREKCREAIDEILAEKVGAAMSCLIAPQITLPDTDEELDEKIVEWCGLMLQMRSDDATPAEVILHAETVPGQLA